MPLGNANPGNVFEYSGAGNNSYKYVLDSTHFPPGPYTLFFTATGDPVTHSAPFLKP
jgi:hypothetical protein